MSQGSNGRQTDGQAGPTGNFLKTFKPRSLAAGKWIGKCGASEGANGSPQLSMAFSLGPNGHLRFASLPRVGVLNTWPKCILCQNVQLDVQLTAFNFQMITLKQKLFCLVPGSKHLHISTFACVKRRLGVTISWLKRSVECLDAGRPGWRACLAGQEGHPL